MATDFVPSKAALLKKNAEADFQVFSYESHKAKKKVPVSSADDLEAKISTMKDTRKGIDIKRARREIIKFGITGFSAEEQQEAKVAQLISLGARPPKNQSKNYKELMKEKATRKAEQKRVEAFQQLGKNAVGASTAKNKKFVFNKALGAQSHKGASKGKGDILKIYGTATPEAKKNNRIGKVRKGMIAKIR